MGCTDQKGYGLVTIGRKCHRAHRVSWANSNGPIPLGGHILHRCDTPSCINPIHLFLGDNRLNVADKVAKGRQAVGDAIGSRMHGERQGHAKLSEEQVISIRNSSDKGIVLAILYGVSESTISEIKNNKAWKRAGEQQ